MTSIRMARTELQRLTARRLSLLALLALVLVPALYAGLHLYANHDPYDNLDQVPAALVMLDEGGTDPDGTYVQAGREVADQLVADGAFDWHEVGPGEARDGVRDGRYEFVLTVPADFSDALTSTARFAPEQARLTMTTHDAGSYLSSTIADTVTARVRDALAARVGSAAAEQFLLGFGEVRGSLESAADGAGVLRDGLSEAGAVTRRLANVATRVDKDAVDLAGGLTTLQQRVTALPGQADRVADSALAVANGTTRVAQVGSVLREYSLAARNAYHDGRVNLQNRMSALGLSGTEEAQLLAVYDQLAGPVIDADQAVADGAAQLQSLSNSSTQVATGSRAIADGLSAVSAGVGQARSTARDVAAGADRLATDADELEAGFDQLSTGGDNLATRLTDGVEAIPAVTDDERTRIAQTIGDPVDIRNASGAEADSYGAGLAPLFVALAAWVGGYVLLLLVRPLSRRAMVANQSPLRVALGGWLTPAILGVGQMAVLLTVVALAVRIAPENLPGTLLFLLLVSATFVAIVHALTAWFGTVGQLVGLVLLVVQLATAGGAFPWQTIPQPLHWVHHLAPMSYAVDGLQQLMYGGVSTLVLRDVLVLLAWFAVALFASTQAARAQRVWTVARVRPAT